MATINSDGEAFWKTNLLILWINQFVSYLGSNISVPFAPFFIRDVLGVSDEGALKIYVGLASSLSTFSLAIMAPIWGKLSDRYGRKIMILRANLLGGLIICCMGLSPFICNAIHCLGISNIAPIHVFLTLRLMMGIFSGISTAALTLVSASTPSNKQGYALALMSAAMYSGDIGGSVLGGYLATWFGYNYCFQMTGSCWILSAVLVFFFVKENFTRVTHKVQVAGTEKKSGNFFKSSSIYLVMLPCYSLFIAYIVGNVARFVDTSQLPLIVEMLNGGKEMPFAAKWTSLVVAGGFIGAMLSGVIIGKKIDKNATKVMVTACSICAFIMTLTLFLPKIPGAMRQIQYHVWLLPATGTLCVLFMLPLRAIHFFFTATLEPIFNTWLSKVTPKENKGMMFGAAVTFRSIGIILAHSLASVIAFHWNLQMVYSVGIFIFLLLIPIGLFMQKQLSKLVAAK